jgi:hypothetical protein
VRATDSRPGENVEVPLVDVTHDRMIDENDLRRLAECLPDVVAEAVDCLEEPWTGPAQAGDMEIRFHRRSEFDVGELGVVVEVRTKFFRSRLDDKQRRANLIRDRLAHLGYLRVGVWLILVEGAWSQD